MQECLLWKRSEDFSVPEWDICQGQTCGKLVKGIVARELHVAPDQVEPALSRAPMRPIEMQVLARDGGAENE